MIMLDRKDQSVEVAVVYLAWGRARRMINPYHRFFESYCTYLAGIDHRLYIIFKGFDSAAACVNTRKIFDSVEYTPIFTGDEGLDIGAYFEAAPQISCEYLCFLNTYSRVNGDDWLKKLYVNLRLPDVGLVGATGSFEMSPHPSVENNGYPNVHVRSNGFMMRRRDFLSARRGRALVTKEDTYLLETGSGSFTSYILQRAQDILVVGKNGRGYSPPFWPVSDTFRQGNQSNLLILDNRTDDFALADAGTKQSLFKRTWQSGHVRPDLAERGNLLGVRDLSR
ncbi:hypothetical protein [Variovorax sp. dw_954]|uniref:hypothetical protein n=1 Tax=Variovorax sp. dw_954 TaxID=2720078 RepID=UPI001BD22631|nr:hypothetical protein [Variovorax sp. dw_954]